MDTAHVHLVLPADAPKGRPSMSRNAKLVMTIPNHEPFEVPGVRAVTLRAAIDDVDIVEVELLGTVEITYGP